jgi:hypothetical protein
MRDNSTVCNAVEIILNSCHTIQLIDVWALLHLALGLMIVMLLFVAARL